MNDLQASHESRLSKKDIFSLLLALSLVLVICFSLISVTSLKARFNILQVVCWLFLVGLACRQTVSGSFSRRSRSVRSGGYLRLLKAVIPGFALYATVLGLYFVSDDFAHLEWAQNPPSELLWEQLTQGQDGAFFRPLGFASLLLDYHLWHDWPLGYHLTNLLLHLAVTAGIFFLCMELGLGSRLAGNAALVFSVLPILAETVTWISARFDLLATCLSIWALVCYVRSRTTAGKHYYFWTVVLFLLALLSKESAFALPALLLLVEILFLKPVKLKFSLGLVMVGCLMFGYRWMVLGGIGGYSDVPSGSPAFIVFGKETLEGLLVRTPTQLLFGFNWLHTGLLPLVIYPSILGGAFLALCFTVRRPHYRKLFWLSAGWIVLAGVPAHSLLLVSPSLAGSRVYYLPAVGAALLTGLLLSSLEPASVRRRWTTVIVLFMGLGLLHNLGAWRRASELSERSLLELKHLEPSPPVQSRFLFLDMPERIDGVYFFVNGLSQAVRLTYSRQDVEAARELDVGPRDRGELADRHHVRIRWLGDDSQLLEVE